MGNDRFPGEPKRHTRKPADPGAGNVVGIGIFEGLFNRELKASQETSERFRCVAALATGQTSKKETTSGATYIFVLSIKERH